MKPIVACCAGIAFLAAGCASKPQPPTAAVQAAPGPDYEAALHALIECGVRQILRLDDGRSDAGLVARAAASRCDREKVGFQEAAINRAPTPRAAQAVPTAVDDATRDTFASLVLEVRAFRRERGRGGAPSPSRRRLDEVAL